MNDITTYKLIFASIAGLLYTFLGGPDVLLHALLVFMMVDFITGILASIADRSGLSSQVGLCGIIKKVMQLFVVGLAVVLDTITGLSDPYIRNTVIYFFLAIEGLSILENAERAGVKVPGFIRSALQQVKEKGELGKDGK